VAALPEIANFTPREIFHGKGTIKDDFKTHPEGKQQWNT